MKKKILFFFSFIFLSFSQSSIDSLSYQQKLRSGEYQFPFQLNEKDDFELPIEFQIELSVSELRDLTIRSNNFYSVFDFSIATKLDSIEAISTGDSLRIYPSNYVTLIYPESDKTYVSDIFYDDKFYYDIEKDSFNQWSGYAELELPHKWDLRDYPFDTQNLYISFRAADDSSKVRLNQSKQFPPKIFKENFKYLLDGFTVSKITTEKNYVKTPFISDDYIEGRRGEIQEQLNFKIEVDRTGSFLYFKLFFGAFLSFLISFLVFFIDSKDFETRITLSLGGIFGSVGNKYFVENTMPDLQVLTKADIINNLVILFIVLNIFIVIGQYSNKINIGKFENNKFSSIFIFCSFLLLNCLIVIF